MKCSEFNKFIQDHVDGCLDDKLTYAMDEHAKSCTCCRQELNCEIKAVEALSSIQTDHTPPYVLREVLDRVQSHNTGNIWLRWSGVGVTVLVAAALLTVNVLRTPNNSPVVTANNNVVAKNLVNVNGKVAMPVEKVHIKIAGNIVRTYAVPFNKLHNKQISRTHGDNHAAPSKSVQNIKRIPSARYFVVMTPLIDPESPVYAGNSISNENHVDSSYSIQVEDRDAATVTNLNVTNEITPEMQPKNTVEYSITNTAPPVENVEPERSYNNEDNRSTNCLDNADGVG